MERGALERFLADLLEGAALDRQVALERTWILSSGAATSVLPACGVPSVCRNAKRTHGSDALAGVRKCLAT